MKSPSTFRRHIKLAALALIPILVITGTSRAATATKAATGTDLTAAASWTGGSGPGFPTSSDTAAWISTSLGAGLTLGSAGSWGGITVSGALTDISITGAGTLTLGASGIDMTGSSRNLTLPPTVAIGANSPTWTVPAGRKLQLAVDAASPTGVLTGTAAAVITVTGGGTVDLFAGGGTSFTTGGMAGYLGKWIVGPGTTLRGQRNGACAWGANTSADAITLNGGTLVDGCGTAFVGNWTWNTPITLAASTSSVIDEQIAGTGSRTLKLMGAISGSGNVTFKETSVNDVFGNNDNGFIIAQNNPDWSGTITIGGPTENGIAGRLSSVRVGGVNGATDTSTAVGSFGTLGTANVINNGVLTLSRNDTWTFANNISGTGTLRIGVNTGSATHIVTVSGSNTHSGGVTIQSAVTLKIGSTNALGTGALTMAGTANFDNVSGGPLTVANALTMSGGSPTFSGTDDMTFNGAGLISGANRTITVSAKNLTLGGAIGEDVAGRNLSKAGGGTLTLGGSSTYSGSTLVTGGRLNVTGSLANTNVSANAGTILGGTGSMAGTVTVNGRLDPGTASNVTALLSFGGSLGLASTATTTFELAGTGRGTTYDAVNVTGALTLDGVVSVTGTHAFAAGDAFQLFSAGSIIASGFDTATDLLLPLLPCSLAWDTSTFTTDGTVRVVASPLVGPPTVADSVFSALGGRLRVRFSQIMDATSVTNLANYTVAGGALTVFATVMPDALTVDLFLTPAPAAGSSHTVYISNVTNCAGTVIAPTTPVNFSVPNLPLVNQLVAAFDGSSSTSSAIDGVNWRDLSGNRNDAVNVLTNANRRPTLVASGLNGHPTLQFVRTNSQTLSIAAATGAGLSGSNHTWFFVVKPTYLASAANVLRHQSSLSSANWGSFFFEGNAGTGSQPALTANGRTTAAGAVEAVAFPVALNSWVIGSGYLDGAAGNVYSRVEAPEAGTSIAATNSAGTATGIGTPIATYIGSVANGTFFDGEMAEVLIYTNALSEAERAQVEDYLRAKYFSAPQVVQHPQSAEVLAGQPVTFSATFTNAALYQWFKDGQPITDATNTAYTISAASSADVAEYVLRGTNAAGHADTAPATLTVNHPPVTSNAATQVLQNHTLTVWLDRLLAGTSDADNDPLAVISAGPASTNGGTVTLTATNILYQPVTDYVGADQFTYTISDGRGGTATGAVSITVLSSNSISLNIVTAPTVLPNGHFFIGFAGIPGISYKVQFATNVSGPWYFLTNLTAGTNGLFELEDPTEPPLPPTRFYRTTYP